MEESAKSGLSDVKLRGEVSENEFVRAVIVKLASDVNTPPDVLSCELSDVWKRSNEFLAVTCDTEVFLTCQIGEDREEKYLGKEEYYDKELNMKRERVVEKTRTVTDWKPFSNNLKKTAQSVVQNSDDVQDVEQAYRAKKAIATCKQYDTLVDGEMAHSKKAIAAAQHKCIAESSESGVPTGSKVKDMKYHGTADVVKVIGVKIDEYSLDCVYNGKKYGARAFASGEPTVDMPERPKDSDKANAKYRKKMLPLYIACPALVVLGVVLSLFIQAVGGLFIGAGLLLAVLTLTVIRSRVAKKMKGERQAVKKDACVALLKKRGLEPLTQAEERAILSAQYTII